VRNALIVLVVVALVIVTLGAVNSGLLFDIDFVAGTWTAVSLFWVAVVIAGVVFVTGVAAALLAASGAVTARRKVEKELQGTYERLRATEAKLPRPVPAAVVEATPGEHTAVTMAALEQVDDAGGTAVVAAPDAATAVTPAASEGETAASMTEPEAETAVVGDAPEAVTGVVGDAPQEVAEIAVTTTPPADAGPLEDAPPPEAS
jgi:hypothetical protein